MVLVVNLLNNNKIMKKYKLIGIEYYAYDCRNLLHALTTFLYNKCGVTVDNIEEFEGEIPEDAIKSFEGI
jgi:hypothetical protein